MNQPSARFPFYLPLRCPIDGGQIEMTGPVEARCVECGANAEKMGRELDRLRAALEPEDGDLAKAARALHRESEFRDTPFDKLGRKHREGFFKQVNTVIKVLKNGIKS